MKHRPLNRILLAFLMVAILFRDQSRHNQERSWKVLSAGLKS